jgi:hypothetical protein
MKTGIHLRMYIEHVKYLSDRKISSTKVVEKIKYTFYEQYNFLHITLTVLGIKYYSVPTFLNLCIQQSSESAEMSEVSHYG